MFATIVSTLGHVRSNRMKVLGVTTKARHLSLPNLPTLVESGFPKLVVSSWQGIFVPAATPRPVVEKLHGVMLRVMADDDVKRRFPTAARLGSPAHRPKKPRLSCSEKPLAGLRSPKRSARQRTDGMRNAGSCALQLAVETMTAVRAVKPILPTKVGKAGIPYARGWRRGRGFLPPGDGPSLSGRARHRSRARGPATWRPAEKPKGSRSHFLAHPSRAAGGGDRARKHRSRRSVLPHSHGGQAVLMWCGTSGCRLCSRARGCWWTRCRFPARR